MKKEKIAILGGGLGAMTAAFYLTSTEELRNKYQVTIYQMGWRLGGKGASGRDIRRGDRIEEHGLHMFMGFYENAFRLMRDAYGEWIKQPQNPFRSWTDAFKPVNLVTLQQEVHGRSGKHWVTRKLEFPELPGLPGDGINLPPLLLLIRDLLGFLKSVFSHLESGWENSLSWEEEIDKALESIGDDLKDAFSVGEKQAARLKDPNDERNAPEGNRSTHPILDAIHGFIDRCFEKDESPDLGADLIRGMQSRLADLQPEEGDGFEDLIFYWNLLDMGLALGLGLLVDVLPYGADGYNRINNQDFRRWLMKHGASEASAWSAGVRALYDLAFAFKGGTGKPDDASMPAGAAAKTMLNLGLAYKGAPLWTMEAGMGDAVFTPMYEILARQRGVEFKFFHKLTGLALDDSGQSVARLDFDVQAEITADQYEPLYEVKGFPCWPSEPAWGQIKNGVELQKAGANFESYWQNHCVRKITLQQGSDFDKVVMGLSIGAFPIVCEALNQNDSWKKMVETTETVQTRAVQLWMKPDPKAMGWEGGTTAMTSYAEPM
ncbi:MAG: NAD(P)-binding protein, partial [Leptospiraceae bacterium]|nr:NAD(P)-binding protein [Leptospiraceae bacterium]